MSKQEIILLVLGSRSIHRYHWCYNCITHALNYVSIKPSDITLLVNGGAEGVDQAAREWAMFQDPPVNVKLYKPDWDNDGIQAGMIRNTEMIEKATHVIAIWDGESSGTQQGIELAKKKGTLIGVFNETEVF